MSDDSKTMIDIVQVIGTLFIAGFAGLIAYGQYQVAQQKLRLDLFTERYKVFEAAGEFLGILLSNSAVPVEASIRFGAATRGARFLFSREIERYLARLSQEADNQRALERAQASSKDPDEKVVLGKELMKSYAWTRQQMDGLPDTFEPYLSIEQRPSFLWRPLAWIAGKLRP